jgi:hypothetical protein
MKPAYGGGWKDVYKVDSRQEFFAAYDQTRELTMMAQEAIDFTEYYRCYCRRRAEVTSCPTIAKVPRGERYVGQPGPRSSGRRRIERSRRTPSPSAKALGYDMNTVEFASATASPTPSTS